MSNYTNIRTRNEAIVYYDPRTFTMKSTTGRLGECAADAIRNAYEFHLLKCPHTYKDFMDRGLYANGIPGVCPENIKGFFDEEATGLKVKIRHVANAFHLYFILKKAARKNHLVIATTTNHMYTIFPSSVNDRTITYKRFYLDSQVRSATLAEEQKGSFGPNLFFCGNSWFANECPDQVIPLGNVEGVFASANFIYEKLGSNYVVEVIGVKTNIGNLKTHPFRFESLKKEYKKYSTKRIGRFDKAYNRLIGAIGKAEGNTEQQGVYYAQLGAVFSHPFLGEKYKKVFNANLPMVV
jgi:hypothetical protein